MKRFQRPNIPMAEKRVIATGVTKSKEMRIGSA